MVELPAALARRVALLAADRESGAWQILEETLAILRAAPPAGVPACVAARAVCGAQPSMAPVWNAALEAIADEREPGRLERFAQRLARAPQALARFAVECLLLDKGSEPLQLVTVSRSGSVRIVLDALRQHRPIHVACSESRPAHEGRTLAAQLAAAGVRVSCFSDAAIAHALTGADAVIVGADAIAPERFLNKSGTRMLAAAAAQQGVPIYVAATRDKFVGEALAAHLVIREGAAAEIWDSAPAGVEVRNPYFEWTPLDVVTAIISDAGVLGVGVVRDVCESMSDPQALQALDA